jgi:hypothetical protein
LVAPTFFPETPLAACGEWSKLPLVETAFCPEFPLAADKSSSFAIFSRFPLVDLAVCFELRLVVPRFREPMERLSAICKSENMRHYQKYFYYFVNGPE